MEHVQERLEDIIAKHVISKLNSKEIERMILSKISEIVEKGFQDNKSYYRTDFDSYVMRVVERFMEEKLNKSYKLDVKMIEKEKKTIKTIRKTK